MARDFAYSSLPVEPRDLKDAGVDPRDRADYLGHENVTLTLDVYTARGGGSTRVADVLSEVVNLG